MKGKTSAAKIIGIAILVLLAVALIAAVFFIDPILKRKLPGWVEKKSEGKYSLTLGDVHVKLLSASVTLSDIKLTPGDQLANLDRCIIEAKELKIEGISIWKALTGNKRECDMISLSGSNIEFITSPEGKDSSDKSSSDEEKPTEFSVGRIELNDISIRYKRRGEPDLIFECKETIAATGLRYRTKDSPSDESDGLFDFSRLEAGRLDWREVNELYKFSLNKLDLNSDTRSCELDAFHMLPQADRAGFYKKVGHQKTMIDILLPTTTLTDIEWNHLTDSGMLVAKELVLDQPLIACYSDRRVPKNPLSKLGRYPSQLLRKVTLPLYVEHSVVKNGEVKYTQLSKETKREGIVNFTHIKGTISNMTNIPSYKSAKAHCVADLKGNFGKSPASLRIDFLLTDSQAAFTATASMQKVSKAQLNAVFTKLAGIEFTSVQLHKLEASLEGNETGIKGRVTMRYDSLAVKLLKADKNGELEDRDFLSFIANKLIRPSNPMPGEPLRHAHVYLKRDIRKSFFNQLWKTIYKGMQKSVTQDKTNDPAKVEVEERKGWRNWFRKKPKKEAENKD